MTRPLRTVHAVLPGDVDDPELVSGGNVYDRRLCQALEAHGVAVREIAAEGSWPRPDDQARAALARALGAVPDGSVVLLDGLVACGVPEVVVPHADRLRLAVLVHMPLADEIGASQGASEDLSSAELDARERETLRAASAVVATGASTARRLISHHGLPAGRVHVVSPGTDAAPLAPGTDGASRLLAVGSVTPTKGHDLLVEALADLADLPGPAWTCTIVGPLTRDPGHVARLRRLIERHGLGERILLAGPQTGGELAAVYGTADLMVLPSRSETYGMVVAEALARGVPVLAAAVGGVPDTLGEDSHGYVPGILVPPDSASIATGLRRWFGEPGLRDRLRTSARHRRDRLETWHETARRMVLVLEKLVLEKLVPDELRGERR
ncbi:glycosyl transferase [Planotetraspora thailandica]|uniref:Glycosyl transferase n=1 Tax=Planotetraspora thailandica TaxID=487172 RepID=A0A8J3Y0M8_9ACTN|nr:glycosyltransferase family 4 protein [Planotetraspora thailandica]GII58672.1 glycosyl transferase [Planotetraspora thailandica]